MQFLSCYTGLLRILAIEYLKTGSCVVPTPLDLVLLFTYLQQNECPFSMEQFEPSFWTFSNCKPTNFMLEVLLHLLWLNLEIWQMFLGKTSNWGVNPGPFVSSSSSLSTILFSQHLQHRQSSPENQTLPQHLEACSLKDLRLCRLKSVIIVFDFSRI